jgi:Prokaryotic membrane lipoprotein lipid attachment site
MYMKKILFALVLIITLSSCTRYGGDSYSSSRRGNIKLYSGSNASTRIIRNNVWSLSKFLSDKLPKQKSDYEVYITDKDIVDFLSEEDFIQHVFDRIKENKFYDDKQQEKAALLTTTDLRSLLENPENMTGQSMYMLPVANIIILRNDENYGRRFFLYSYITLLLCDNNPNYYLNPSKNQAELTDTLLFKFMLSGFPSIYSRYFSKYPGRDPSNELYLMLAEIDIQYLEDIYELDLRRFKSVKETQLAYDEEAVIYYAYFFKYLFETMDNDTVLELLDSLFIHDQDRSADLRRIYYEWKDQL